MCRLLARKANGRRGLSHEEIAKLSGLSKSHVAALSVSMSWENCTLDTIQKFSSSCGVNLNNPSQCARYLKRAKMMHIDRAHKNQKAMYLRIFSVTEK